jgi:hypothetical protein
LVAGAGMTATLRKHYALAAKSLGIIADKPTFSQVGLFA